MELLQIGTHQVDQILSQFWSDLFLGSVHQMKTNVRLKYFSHQAIDAATDGSQQHQLPAAVLAGHQRPLHGVQLSAQLLNALQQLHLLPILMRHCILPLDNTHWGYSIYPVGV
jgi:hypothetical protein